MERSLTLNAARPPYDELFCSRMLDYLPVSGSHSAELKEKMTFELSKVGFFTFLRFSEHRNDYLPDYVMNEIFNELSLRDSLLMQQIIEEQISALTVYRAAKFIDRFGLDYSIERIFTQLVSDFGQPVQPLAPVEWAPLSGFVRNAAKKDQVTTISQLHLDLIFKASTPSEKNAVRQVFLDNPLSPDCHEVLQFHREFTVDHAQLLPSVSPELTPKHTRRELMQMALRGHIDPSTVEVNEAIKLLDISPNVELAKMLSLDQSRFDLTDFLSLLFEVQFEGRVLVPLLHCKALVAFKRIPEQDRSDVLLRTISTIDQKIKEAGDGFINDGSLLILFKTLAGYAPVDSRPLLLLFRQIKEWPNYFKEDAKEKFETRLEKIMLNALFAPTRAYGGKLIIGSYGTKSFDLLLNSGVMRLDATVKFYSLQADYSHFDQPAKKAIAGFCLPYLIKPIDYLTPELTAAEIQLLVDSDVFTKNDWKIISNNEHARKKFSHVRLPQHVLPLVNERMHEMALTVDLGL
jgi:hypothetical protein